LPREVFFFGFGFADDSLPAAAARAFCFFVATNPPIAGAGTVLLDGRSQRPTDAAGRSPTS
jgi:hypothetical protein